MFAKANRVFTIVALIFLSFNVFAKDPMAQFEPSIEPDLLVLQPLHAEVAGFTLKVRGAQTFYSQVLNDKTIPIIALHDPDGIPLPDGLYTYEVISMPALGQLPQLESKRMSQNERLALKQTHAKENLFSGTFRILNGEFVLPTKEQAVAKTDYVDDADEGRDVIHNDDVIITSSLCVGFDCVNGEVFGSDTIRLKENNLRIHFQDTSTSGSFPTRDWRIIANSNINGGGNYLAFEDSDAGRQTFVVEAGAPSNALYVDDGGRVGFGTATPVVDLHAVSGNTPTLRLEQNGTSGFQPQTWDVAGNEASFFIRDATNGSTLPFRIYPSSASNTLNITGDGVGIKDTTPEVELDVTGSATLRGNDPVFTIDDTSTASTSTTQVMELRSQSPVQFQMSITEPGNLHAWAFKVGNSDFAFKENSSNNKASTMILLEGGGLQLKGSTVSDSPAATPLFEVDSGGTGRLNGALITTSDVAAKENLGMVDPMSILARVNELPIARWQYLQDDCAADHIGPMAQDFHELFGLGRDEKGIANVDTAGVALASIQALSQQVEAKDAEIAELKAKSAALEARLAALEKALLK